MSKSERGTLQAQNESGGVLMAQTDNSVIIVFFQVIVLGLGRIWFFLQDNTTISCWISGRINPVLPDIRPNPS